MINKIKISGFRSIEKQEVDLAPLTVLYGPTASGKSSLLYSLLVLKNFVANPNQQPDGFFSIGFMNLGGFEACVFDHKPDKAIEVLFSSEDGEYGLAFLKGKGEIYLKSSLGIEMRANITIPYALNQNFTFQFKEKEDEYSINWNGITSSVAPKQPTADNQQRALRLTTQLNRIPDVLKKIDIVPHRRGFFSQSYSPGAINPIPTTEGDVASLIINDPNLSPKISVDLEKIIERDFRLYTAPGTATVFFNSTDKKARVPGYLVNDGFGVNQIVYMLAKIHRVDIETILIEEPEIHLHPKMIRLLVRVLNEIIKTEGKQIILVTHSEIFVSSLLNTVAEKIVSPDDIKCYLATKENKATIYKPQKIQENGQVEGGLSSFMEGELEDLKVILGLKK
ncbi:MAG: AAA family ATPase [Deltaproteobacteria bacterium]|nr:AAA family ATPase [Deltaproteobacteria bacterium]MCL5276722.1 AAA family ATPase [Deltaproteobacteria bacterium]